jgi:NADPH-dependent curcumin reductase CurA
MAITNKKIVLAARPAGMVKETDFRLEEAALPELNEGEVLVHSIWLSVDPYMRDRMNDRKSYAESVGIGDVMTGEIVGRIEQSRNVRFQEGDIVAGQIGWQDYAISDGSNLRNIDPTRAPISTGLHVLGMPGLTAYFGLTDVCQAKEGETVVVSGAAGAVGSAVGQLAKSLGCRVVGVAGSDEKINWLTEELGFDAAINYKTTENYYRALRRACPDGIDCYFDNVGGPVTDAVFSLLAERARIAICGQISMYNSQKAEEGPRLLWNLIVKRATVRGFLAFDYADRFGEGMKQLGARVRSGELRYRESIVEGLENAPRAFIGLFEGANIGKQLVRISEA